MNYFESAAGHDTMYLLSVYLRKKNLDSRKSQYSAMFQKKQNAILYINDEINQGAEFIAFIPDEESKLYIVVMKK